MKRMTWAQLFALHIAEREPIRHTAQGYSYVEFAGVDYWAYTPAGVAPQPEAAA